MEEGEPRSHAPVCPDTALYHARPLQVEPGGAGACQLQAPLQEDGELVSQHAALLQQCRDLHRSVAECMALLQHAAQPAIVWNPALHPVYELSSAARAPFNVALQTARGQQQIVGAKPNFKLYRTGTADT